MIQQGQADPHWLARTVAENIIRHGNWLGNYSQENPFAFKLMLAEGSFLANPTAEQRGRILLLRQAAWVWQLDVPVERVGDDEEVCE